MSEEGTSRLRGTLRTLAQAILALALLELCLMFAGIGDRAVANAGRLPYQRIDLPLFEADGTGRFTAHEERLGTQSFPVDKPKDEVRIFLLGGSALRGLGQSPGISIASQLERCLERTDPSRRFRVLNCGIVGISSLQVREMCADVLARYAPDAIVVCSGNNEFLELHAKEFQRLERSAFARALQSFTSRLRLLHLVRNLTGSNSRRAQRSEDGAVRMTADFFLDTVELSQADVDTVVETHRANLNAVVSECGDANVPLILATVPANLRWDDPYPGSDWQARWFERWDVSEADQPSTEDARLTWLAEEARRRWPTATPLERTELAMLEGRCLEARGSIDEARDAYARAIEVDPHFRRTLGAMNATIRELGARNEVALADTVAALRELQPIPDERFFYDHIHFNPEGAASLASLFAKRLADKGVGAATTSRCREELVAAFEGAAERSEDAPELDRWIGFDFDPAFIADTDLWKYDRGRERLVEMLRRDDLAPEKRGKALTYLGNHHAFEAGELDLARQRYEEALPLVPEWKAALEANLAWIKTR